MKLFAAEFYVLRNFAGHGHRSESSQHFLHGERHKFWVCDETCALFRVLRQVPDARSDRRPSGVDPCKEDQRNRASYVVVGEGHSFNLCLQQKAD